MSTDTPRPERVTLSDEGRREFERIEDTGDRVRPTRSRQIVTKEDT